ncbi:polysaccharide lyase family 7 protein [Winogradskyella immobilis]|uniref:Polysaccharide lyase family 7 protein n=1 Tax=Winogradskyella immobilis TaxID=2816852 RepID=A0ABS8ELC6_9FLAO|nr:polysaccharide lyase family 7 protein [Winogradskyella immobilis]MCC1484028.1 polysaccharide lyase family 7 protein [Winogradskyella immobilis]MCG0016120.1 polysaccharide lyase family 7 protein [Winogradskyella immobilis]
MRYQKKTLLLLITFVFSIYINAQDKQSDNASQVSELKKKDKKSKKRKKKVKLPNIDLSHWKVTLPVNNDKGRPYEISPPEIKDFALDEVAKPYMYIDSTRGAIVFHALPTESKTRNTKFTRSELREQMVPGENNVNWTFKDGGYMKGKLAIDEVTKDSEGKYHRVIIMQIHGRLTNEQRDLIGEDDNNAPPILKIYWDKGKVRVKTKVLKDLNASDTEILHEDAWGNDVGFNFEEEVGFRKFTLEVKVSEGKMVIILNKNEYKVYDSIHIKKWGVFENYFKAGNYFQTRDEGAYAKVRYYELEVSH